MSCRRSLPAQWWRPAIKGRGQTSAYTLWEQESSWETIPQCIFLPDFLQPERRDESGEPEIVPCCTGSQTDTRTPRRRRRHVRRTPARAVSCCRLRGKSIGITIVYELGAAGVA